METFPALLALCAGNSPVTVEFPAHRPVTRSFDVPFDLRVSPREAGDLRRHHAHYDVIVMVNYGNAGALLSIVNSIPSGILPLLWTIG